VEADADPGRSHDNTGICRCTVHRVILDSAERTASWRSYSQRMND
jgi:hypothetical protein